MTIHSIFCMCDIYFLCRCFHTLLFRNQCKKSLILVIVWQTQKSIGTFWVKTDRLLWTTDNISDI